ncbi:caspase family protein [Candidatus Poribacteria bacterium]
MSEYMVYKNASLVNSASAVTHALIIGVGDYPYLQGGSADSPTPMHGGMGQLSSPPLSARQIATWLMEDFSNPGKPLATVSMLISEQNPMPFSPPGSQAHIDIRSATLSNVEEAVEEWFRMGNQNEEHLLLFFFCGHGVADGIEQSLLLEDYGESPIKPMSGAIDFMAFHRGMRSCAASQQCYFVDACRTISDVAIDTSYAGDPIVQDSLERSPGSIWETAVFFSTVVGEAAYGRTNEVTVYTEHLLAALDGTGSDDRAPDGKWRVSTSNLQIALSESMKRHGYRNQFPVAMYMMDFYIHELAGLPKVPVSIYCEPESANCQATLSYHKDRRMLDQRAPNPERWETNILFGAYEFMAEINSVKTGKSQRIRPPARDVRLEVSV